MLRAFSVIFMCAKFNEMFCWKCIEINFPKGAVGLVLDPSSLTYLISDGDIRCAFYFSANRLLYNKPNTNEMNM